MEKKPIRSFIVIPRSRTHPLQIIASSSILTIYSIGRIQSGMEVSILSKKKILKIVLLVLSALLAASQTVEEYYDQDDDKYSD